MKHLLTTLAAVLAAAALQAQESERLYLSGTDKDHTRTWDFFCTGGAKSGRWTKIEVPSCWELQGFGTYNYGHDRPHATEQGRYRHIFRVPRSMNGRRIYLVFDGSMTDTEVMVNGRSAGERHQGAFYPFRYDVTSLLYMDGRENLLEVTVSKESSNESVNRAERQADYWIFGGIFRPVYLLAVPQQHIDRVAIDARANGDFTMRVAIDGEATATETDIVDLKTGRRLATLKGDANVSGRVDGVTPWNFEAPYLYEAVVRLMKGRTALHVYRQRFGFRTIEFRERDGFYLNGERVMFKGVCRHTFWPDSGRTSSPALAVEDINLIKDMNMNAVRMSHYPPDEYFLDKCDEMGLMVIDELAGWQKKYDTDVARKLVRAMIERDVNHPSIMLWANSNEGGFNHDIRPDYGILDPQHRKVVEPWSRYDGIDTHHYPKYNDVAGKLEKKEAVFMPTEMIHGLFDGGHGAGLDDYWRLMRASPTAAGGFLWNLADEGVVRHDKNDIIDCDALHAPDGIVGPHHEKEGSFYAIKSIWSPVQIEFKDKALRISNQYTYTNLRQCRFEYDTVRLNSPLFSGAEERRTLAMKSPDLAPGQSREFPLPPQAAGPADMLVFRAYDPTGRLIDTWTLRLKSTQQTAERILSNKVRANASVKDRVRLTVPGKMEWSEQANGWLRLDFEYTLDGDYDFAGLTLDYPEAQVEGATLLADGPYHAWKNRLRGNQFGQWEKKYNNTVTGETWEYPEFKGYYSGFQAVRLKTKGEPLTIVAATDGLFLRLFTPDKPKHRSNNVEPPFPEGGISVLNCIPAIGNKFQRADQVGPQSRKAHFDHKTIRGTVYFGQ